MIALIDEHRLTQINFTRFGAGWRVGAWSKTEQHYHTAFAEGDDPLAALEKALAPPATSLTDLLK